MAYKRIVAVNDKSCSEFAGLPSSSARISILGYVSVHHGSITNSSPRAYICWNCPKVHRCGGSKPSCCDPRPRSTRVRSPHRNDAFKPQRSRPLQLMLCVPQSPLHNTHLIKRWAVDGPTQTSWVRNDPTSSWTVDHNLRAEVVACLEREVDLQR